MSAPIVSEFDAETHIGLVPNVATTAAATYNTNQLNLALAAQWAGGNFTFKQGVNGPVLKPIRFQGKTYYFNGTIKTAARSGGALFGVGNTYEQSDASFSSGAGVIGGMPTRLVMIGSTTDPLLRLCGSNFKLGNLELWGRRIAAGGAASGSGAKCATLIEVESRTQPVTGRHAIENVSLFEASVGTRALAGYYSGTTFIANEDHADNVYVHNIECSGVDTMFRSENAQAVGWTFDGNIVFNSYGYGAGGVSEDGIILDIVRGGNVYVPGHLQLNTSRVCILKASISHAPNANHFTISDFEWDHNEDNANSYLTLFKWAGADGASTNYKFAVRMSGHINNPDTIDFDESRLIEIGAGAVGFPKGDLLFDVTNLPTSNFTILGSGPWYKPS